VFVDEYQDVDEQQYRLLRRLTSPTSRICAIGDPDQAIYGFRGGDVGYFLRFQEDFDSAPTMRLSRSYRSAPTIVRSAMQLIKPGTLVPGRELVPARTDIPDGPVALHAVADERAEAEAVAASIETMLGGASFHALDSRAVDGRNKAVHQLSFADFAVLYRTSAQAAAVGEALERHGFPFQRRSHARLAEMPGVPEILAAMSPVPVLDLASAPGPVPVTEVLAAAVGVALSACGSGSGPGPGPGRGRTGPGRTGPGPGPDGGGGGGGGGGSHGQADAAAARMAIRAAADVLGPLAERCGGDLDRFLDELALGAEVDAWDPRADRITLLTLHAAKGLEFPVVFIVGCDDGLLPLRPWHGADIDYAEERRLLFVGLTRATTRLELLTAAKRTLRGEVTECSPSPFLSSIDPALLERHGGGSGPRNRRRERPQQTTLF
jgi:superfamily I DNA/RNA helicase